VTNKPYTSRIPFASFFKEGNRGSREGNNLPTVTEPGSNGDTEHRSLRVTFTLLSLAPFPQYFFLLFYRKGN
jgi:hypothetical protein